MNMINPGENNSCIFDIETISTERAEKNMNYIIGRVISLSIGECAFIRTNRGTIRTSTVLNIIKNDDSTCLFETRNSFYCVTEPEPIAATEAVISDVFQINSTTNTVPRSYSSALLCA